MNALIDWCGRIASQYGVTPESTSYLESVEGWRVLWRPARVRALLVAESHVRELPGDDSVSVSIPSLALGYHPRGYCRLVYCLGYGEDALCSPRPQANAGTWQYWDLLGQIAGGHGYISPRVRSSTLKERVAWKIQVLTKLQARGIWLVDAAVTAFYSPGGTRPFRGAAYRSVLQESWSRFVWPNVMHEPLEAIWIVGRGVKKCLRGRPELESARTVSQPQDRDFERFRSDLKGMVDALDAIR
jgi:hypothetical protein